MSSVLLLALAHLMFLILVVFLHWFSIYCILKFEFFLLGFGLLLVLWDSSFCLLHWVFVSIKGTGFLIFWFLFVTMGLFVFCF
jgi:hypothetical protein